jgi:hypothetical protein
MRLLLGRLRCWIAILRQTPNQQNSQLFPGLSVRFVFSLILHDIHLLCT